MAVVLVMKVAPEIEPIIYRDSILCLSESNKHFFKLLLLLFCTTSSSPPSPAPPSPPWPPYRQQQTCRLPCSGNYSKHEIPIKHVLQFIVQISAIKHNWLLIKVIYGDKRKGLLTNHPPPSTPRTTTFFYPSTTVDGYIFSTTPSS